MTKSARLFIATPCYTSHPSIDYVASVVKLIRTHPDLGANFCWNTNNGLIAYSRMFCVAEFMADESASHLLFADDDIGFSTQTVIRLIEHDKDVVSALYFKKRQDKNQAAACPLDGAKVDDKGLIELAAGGLGLVLIKRSVFERILKARPDLRCHTLDDGRRLELIDCFHSRVDEHGQVIGEDTAFFRLWRSIGGTAWLDTHAIAEHVGLSRFPIYRSANKSP